MKITINWGKPKPARAAKIRGRSGKGDHDCGCGAPIPRGTTACGRCRRAAAADQVRARRAGVRTASPTEHRCPDGKTRTMRQGVCPGPFC
jgi:hypothetical protein